jgi:hypothetical protein
MRGAPAHLTCAPSPARHTAGRPVPAPVPLAAGRYASPPGGAADESVRALGPHFDFDDVLVMQVRRTLQFL